jgi:hypothetical protein
MSFESDFASHTNINWQGNVGTVEYGGGDRTMVVMFYNRPVHSPAKSQEAGSPIYEDQIYVRIHPPGERLSIVDRPATDQDRRRWPMQWGQFKDNRKQVPEGTPIDLLYPEQPSVGAMMRASGVHTIEQCAELSGNAIETIGMGAQSYVNAAKKYLEAANKGVGASQMRHELEQRDSEIRTLKHQIDMLKQHLAKVEENNSQRVDLGTIQALLAQAQGRPQFPDQKQLPNQFDVQSAQINAVHTTKEVAQKQPRRKRHRIDE